MWRGEDFLSGVLASSGFNPNLLGGNGYQRLDFIGRPVEDPWRGIDPTNAKKVRVRIDDLDREYATLNRDTELALSLPTPDRVFDKNFWKALGKNSTTLEWLFRKEAPSLNQLKTKDGGNAYDLYRNLVYKGTATKDTTVSTGSSGDRVSIGSIPIQKGETLEDALRRTVDSAGYQDLTPDAREKVWKAIFGYFKKHAKKEVGNQTVVTPELFEDSRYGSPIDGPTSITDTKDAGKTLAKEVQTTRGYPKNLDEVFSID